MTVKFRTLELETSGQGKVNLKRNGASRQQDLLSVQREDVHDRGRDK